MLTNLINSIRIRFILEKYKTDWPRTILLILLILAVTSALWQWAMPQVKIITQNQFHPVPVIHEVEKVKRVYVACPESGIVTLDKAELGKKLGLDFLQGGDIAKANQNHPPSIPPYHGGGLTPSLVKGRDGEGLEVIATADLPESDDGVDVVALMDMATGETTLVAKEAPSPLFQFRNNGAIGVRYGFNQRLENIGNVYGRWDFLRIKNIYFSANGEISTGADATIQLGAEYRW